MLSHCISTVRHSPMRDWPRREETFAGAPFLTEDESDYRHRRSLDGNRLLLVRAIGSSLENIIGKDKSMGKGKVEQKRTVETGGWFGWFLLRFDCYCLAMRLEFFLRLTKKTESWSKTNQSKISECSETNLPGADAIGQNERERKRTF